MSRRLPALAALVAAALLLPVTAHGAGAVGAASPAAAPGQRLSELGFRDLDARGTLADVTAFVPLPPGYGVHGGNIDVHFAHSPLLLADRSTITLLVGDRPLASARLTGQNAQSGHLRVALPALPDVDGGFVLTVRFAMRLLRDRCEDPQNPALWARVRADSTVAPALVPARRTLADVPRTLVPALPGNTLAIQLPPRPTAGELEAAGVAAAAVGRVSAARNANPLVGAVGVAPADGPSIVVASGSRLPPLLPDGGRTPAAPGRGLLATFPDGPPRLVIGGSDDKGVRRAAAALTPGRLTPLSGTVAQVTGSSPGPRAPERATAWRERTASFAQLGIGTREVTGTGTQTLDLVVDRPPQWRISDGAVLDLRVDTGAALGSRNSGVTVTVAGQEIGTRSLRAAAGTQRLRFAIPAGILDTDLAGRAVRHIPVAVRFDLAANREPCTPVDATGARVAVLASSSLTLPHHDTDAQDLSRFPAPLAVPGRRVDIVLPRRPMTTELSTGLQLAAAVGRWSDPAAPLPRLVTSDGLGRSARDRHSLILVGGADRELGRHLGAPGDAPVVAGEGLLVLRDSPWADRRVVLSVSGDAQGLTRAARALTRADTVQRLAGRASRVAPGPQALVAADPQAGPPLALAPVQADSLGDRVPVWAVPAGVVLLALLAIGGSVARRRWGPRRRA